MTLKARITAIDRFIKGCREDGIYDDLNACCVMAGWDSLAGALTPLKGAAPTNNGFLAADFDRGIGLQGDGSSKYLDSNRGSNADGRNDFHHSLYVSNANSGNFYYMGQDTGGSTGATAVFRSGSALGYRNRSSGFDTIGLSAIGFLGQTRASSSEYSVRSNATSTTQSRASQSPAAVDVAVYAGSVGFATAMSDATLSFYSIGSATDLALLDARVSTLMADLRAIEEAGFDRDAIAYLRAVEEADGAFLETDVKVAVNNLVSGLKADGLWDAIGSSCLLCGPRTLAGALVPLKGDAPTAYSFSSGDYLRSAGLKGDGATTSLDTNYGPENLNDADVHLSVYMTQKYDSGTANRFISQDNNNLTILDSSGATGFRTRVVSSTIYTLGTSSAVPSLVAVSRSSAESFAWFAYGENGTQSDSGGAVNEAAGNPFVFKGSVGSTNFSANRFAFYSIGSSLDLAKLNAHISSYVTAIGAAL
jgi:hypothetical protein